MSAIAASDVKLGAHRFRLYESGKPGREAVLWLHGSGPGVTALTNWEDVLGTFAADFHNLAPDLIGFGDSSHPDPPPQGLAAFTELRIDALLGLLDEQGLERVHLVGNSMGGIVSVQLAMRAPERVARIVLMGTGGAPVPPTPELMKLITFYDDPTREAMADLVRSFVYDPACVGGDLEKIAAARMPVALRPEVRRSHLATFSPGPPLPFAPQDLARVAHPTLVVHGREDRIIPVAVSHYFAMHLPDARLYVMPHAGHWLQLEHPLAFANLVRAFLQGGL
ncbi:MAG TPA: alpha/beta hydrolase [Deltaproteobacteria bacterium]|nr:alpha/beta hydrolase [Deltaproteobacteria bacterium]